MIRCRVCDREFNWITHSHLRTHGLDEASYQKKFPGAPLMSKVFRKKRSEDRRRDWERDPKRRKRMSRQTTKRWEDPRYKKRVSAAIKKTHATEEVRERKAEITRETWKDPEVRKRRRRGIRHALRTTEYREAAAQRMRESWQDPEYQAKVLPGLQKGQQSSKRRKAVAKAKARQWRDDAEYRAKMTNASRAQWTDKKKEQRSEEMSRLWAENRDYRERMSENSARLWQDEEHRKRMAPIVDKWTGPEKVVRAWLREMGLYRTGHDGGVGFLPHRWLPTRGAGFSANGDFVDYNHRIVIHIDGPYHYDDRIKGYEKRVANDVRVNDWCEDNDWRYLRLTDIEIGGKPNKCRQLIRELVENLK